MAFYDNNFRFKCNVSLESYQKKTDAQACLSGPGARAIGKNKMAFQEKTMDVDLFLAKATSGHTFCNLFDIDPNKKYPTTYNGITTTSFPVYKKGPNKGGLKLSFKSDQYFCGAQTIFVDIDKTRFSSVPDYLNCLTLKPTCTYMSYSDGIDKHGQGISRRFRMVYVFDRVLNAQEFRRISRLISALIVRDTGEDLDDSCGERPSQYMNGVWGNAETYASYQIYTVADFPDEQGAVAYEDDSDIVLTQIPNEAINFNAGLLWDMQRLSYDEFMHRYSRCYNYEYRTVKEDAWQNGLFQKTGDEYLQLWVYPEKVEDGNRRRTKLFKAACLRRLMNPTIDADTLLFNLYVDLWRFYDNSDGVIDLECLKRKASNAMRMTPEQLENYCAYERSYWRENRPECIFQHGTERATINGVLRQIRYSGIDKIYNRNISLRENIEAGIGIPQTTLYRFCHDLGINTDPNHGLTFREQREMARLDKEARIETFREYYDTTVSLRTNKTQLFSETGLNMSIDTIRLWAKKYCHEEPKPQQSLPVFDWRVSCFDSFFNPANPQPVETIDKEIIVKNENMNISAYWAC